MARTNRVRKSAPVASLAEANDDFWDDEISTDLKLAAEPKEAAASEAKNVSSAVLAAAEAELKAKKGKKVRWGFQWHKVGGGAAMFVGAGLATLFLVLTTGRIFIYLAVITIIGLFTMLSGLMGEEGIWGEDEFD